MNRLDGGDVVRFREQGYLVVDGIFDPDADFEPLEEEYAGVLDRLAYALLDQGRLATAHAGLPFARRLIAVCRDSGQTHGQVFNPTLPPGGVREDTPYWAGPAVFRLLTHERLLDAVESLIGPEITAAPIAYTRLKPPRTSWPRDPRGGVLPDGTPPHQYNAGIPPDADGTELVTAWFPLADVSREGGCLCVWPGSHRLGLLPHRIHRGRPRIPGPHLKAAGRPRVVPVGRGSVLFMHRCLVHAALPNRSDRLRRSLDFRYHPTGQPAVRGYFPDFVARSRAHPERESRDPLRWNRRWEEASAAAARNGTPIFHRWPT